MIQSTKVCLQLNRLFDAFAPQNATISWVPIMNLYLHNFASALAMQCLKMAWSLCNQWFAYRISSVQIFKHLNNFLIVFAISFYLHLTFAVTIWSLWVWDRISYIPWQVAHSHVCFAAKHCTTVKLTHASPQFSTFLFFKTWLLFFLWMTLWECTNHSVNQYYYSCLVVYFLRVI